MGYLSKVNAIIWCLLIYINGCSQQMPSEITAVSNRPQSWKKFVGIMKLQEKPLLATSSVDGRGRRLIVASHRRALLAEQERVITELQELSSEISVVFRYRLVLNGLAIVAPEALREQIQRIATISSLQNESFFHLPEAQIDLAGTNVASDSAAFIGSKRVHSKLRVKNADGVPIAVRGDGIRIAIIDTGIDYFHQMLGGAGNVQDYRSNDPSIIEEGSFPTATVVAGIDLVGSAYNPSSSNFARHIPYGDGDPLDEHGHGSHVAAIAAGRGDGKQNRDGVAPEASLVAVKIFGAGSTGETVIIKAIEYAIDPNGDLELSDQSHVANLSIGRPYGRAATLYQEAINTAARGGTIIVASAGNSGRRPFVVGDPSTAEEAISVAASVDNDPAHWRLPGIHLNHVGHKEATAEAVESHVSKPLAETGTISAPFYYIGLAAEDLTVDQRYHLRNKIALIDRGQVSFDQKFARAVDAGAIAIVVVNDLQHRPFPMWGSRAIPIPALMIARNVGEEIKRSLANGVAVRATLDAQLFFERRELIDSIAWFSSQGPRGFDALIKPEIAAPGLRIVSAAAGSGNRKRRMSGTSMSAPFVSGVVALARQYRPKRSASGIRAMVIGSAQKMTTPTGIVYDVYQQGNGRVDAYQAVTSNVVFQPSTLSLGILSALKHKKLTGTINVRNLSAAKQRLTVRSAVDRQLKIILPETIELPANKSVALDYQLIIDATNIHQHYTNLDGFIELLDSDQQVVAQLPLLVGVRKPSRLQAESAIIHATSEEDAYRATVDVKFNNAGTSDGKVMLFELLGVDERKPASNSEGRPCDLQSVGYRAIDKFYRFKKGSFLQFAVKLYYPQTTWHTCEVSIQFDHDHDNIADQELVVGDNTDFIETIPRGEFFSILSDAHIVRSLRRSYENSTVDKEDYSPAVLSYIPLETYNNSSLVIASVNLNKLARDRHGNVRLKLSVSYDSETVEDRDDFLGDQWLTLSPNLDSMGFWKIPDFLFLKQGQQGTLSLTKGGNPQAKLIAYFPHNTASFLADRDDYQSQIVDLSYRFHPLRN